MKSIQDRIKSLSPEQKALFEKQLKARNIDSEFELGSEQAAIPRRSHQGSSPLSFDQERLWLFNRMHPESHTYNVYGAARLKGELHHEALERGINEIVKRHEAWRTVFDRVDPVQTVLPELQVSVPQVDLRHLHEESRESTAQELMREEVQRLFDLQTGPLIRFKLFTLSDTEAMLVLTIHHIVIDRITFSIFFEELMTHYEAALAGVSAILPELPIQYADYAQWQRTYLQGETREKLLQFWKEQLMDCEYILDIETDFPRPAAITYRGARVFIRSPKDVLDRLKHIAKQENATAFMVVMAAFQTLLYRYTGQSDIMVGTPLANRNRIEMEKVMGYFLTMGTIRSRMTGSMSFLDLLRNLRETAMDVYRHQEMPIGLLLDELRVPIDPSRNPLVQAVFVYVDVPEEKFTLPGLTVTTEMIDGETAKYDVTIGLSETEYGLEGFLEYSPDLFRKETFEQMAVHWDRLLRSIANDPQQSLHELDMLTEDEYAQVVHEWNDTDKSYASDSCLHHLFEKQAQAVPDHTAIIYGDQTMTYRELNERANQIAHALKKAGIEPEARVGLFLERSPEMIAAMLGIMKAGGAYVALDPSFPEERIRQIAVDSDIDIVVSRREGIIDDLSSIRHILTLDEKWESIQEESANNPLCVATTDHLAYLMFTSGSTGKPNGVSVEHRSLCNAVTASNSLLGISENDIVLQFASPTFDASVFEIFCTLTSGAALCLVSPEARAGGEALLQFLKENCVTSLLLTPSILSTMDPHRLPPSLHTIATGGEACSFDIRDWLSESRKMFNLYGPTETTIFVTMHEFTAESRPTCIGRPIPNTQIYILDKQLAPVPVGVRGELYVSGANVARGYWNNPQLTAERFVPHPFHDGVRMYRTGDYAKWLPDGTIEFLGRRDDQVKINGIRIETGEIERHLERHPNIHQAFVAAKQIASGHDRLCAYFRSDRELDGEELRAMLTGKLPTYMIPTYYTRVDSFPVTSSGKLEAKLLPEPAELGNSEDEYTPPESETEKVLATVWEEVLGAKNIGLFSNFFHLGGDSIMAIQIASRLFKKGWELEMNRIFIHPVLKDLSRELRPVGNCIEQGMVTGIVKETPVIRWFFESGLGHTSHWNQAVMNYADAGLDETAVRSSLEKLVEHHDMLRLVMREDGDLQQLSICDLEQQQLDLDIIYLDTIESVDVEITRHANLLHESIDLHNGPLLKAILFKTPSGDHLLLIAHHLIMDWVSWQIVLEDFETCYEQAISHEAIALPLKTDSFQKWAEQVNRYACSGELLREIDYWANVEQTLYVPIPKDHVCSDYRMGNESEVCLSLTVSETEQLLKKVHHAYKTEINDILLAGLGLTLKEWTEVDRIVVNLEGHGREPIVKEINMTRTVGWFTTQFPVVLHLAQGKNLPYTIKSVKEQLRRVPNNGIGYEILKYLTPKEQLAELTFRLRPEVSFNYLGQIDRDMRRKRFEPSSYSMGRLTSSDADRTSSLLLTGYVQDGRMHLIIAYNRLEYDKETMTALLERFQMNLRSIIKHCAEQKLNDPTPSDLGYGNLSLEQLEQVYGLVESVE
jgi:fengycin family lipopeptide synthetase B